MRCPFCSFDDSQVIDSRTSEDGGAIRRRRQCSQCGKRFTTYERMERSFPAIVKKNGSRVEFDRDKLRASFLLALRKRPVKATAVDEAINRVEERALACGEREISSETLGLWVMESLKSLDAVAYIRFASVYQQFDTVDSFAEAVREIIKPSPLSNGS